MNARGHNERSYRLDALAAEAREGLAKVEQGEEFTIAGWLAFGHALNEGRALFPGDREFGEWMRSANLAEGIHDHDRAAAMWAAANSDQFEEARQRGNPRTIRGIHAKWKEIEAEREAEARKAAEAEAETVADHEAPTDDTQAPLPVTSEPQPAHKPLDTSEADNAGISVAPDAAGGPAPEPDGSPTGAEPEPAPDPHRKGLSQLTRDGLEDECAGLRAENAELRERVAKQRGNIADLKARIKELAADNKGATIAGLQKRLEAANYRRDEALRVAKREEYKRKQAEKHAAEVEQIEVPYG